MAGDTITSLGGKTVDSATTLGQLMIGYHPGDTVTIGWVDTAGTARTAKVTLVSGCRRQRPVGIPVVFGWSRARQAAVASSSGEDPRFPRETVEFPPLDERSVIGR